MGSKRAKSAVLIRAASAGLTGFIWSSFAAAGMAQTAGVTTAVAPITETSCRQTNGLTGIYVQPSLESGSRGILASGQTVRLEMTSSGTGWARVTEPLIGWVEAKYLTPSAPCSSLTAAPALAPSPARPAAQPAAAANAAVTNAAVANTVTAVCDVLPSEGLVVRSEPTTTGNTALQTIPKGTYQFQFTSDHVRSHSGEVERHWAYITAPYQGWIAVGTVGGQFNLGGKSCG